MITYDAFWEYTKKRKISQYSLNKDYGLDFRLLDRLRNNKPIKTSTINRLCEIFGITPKDIITYYCDSKK